MQLVKGEAELHFISKIKVLLKKIGFTLIILSSVILSGCSFLLPTSTQDIISPWETFESAKKAFDQIVPFQTTEKDLKAMGFDPFTSSNVEVLTYLDIIQRFSFNPTLKKEDLDKELVDCLSVKSLCKAYKVSLSRIKNERKGFFLLDLLRFRRLTHTTGWKLTAFIVLQENFVVYKLWSGKPLIYEEDKKINPLGILQDPAGIATGATSNAIF